MSTFANELKRIRDERIRRDYEQAAAACLRKAVDQGLRLVEFQEEGVVNPFHANPFYVKTAKSVIEVHSGDMRITIECGDGL